MATIKNPVTIVQASSGDNKLPQLVDGSITTITAEDLNGCTEIRNNCFQSLSYLTSVELPSSLATINKGAFYGCSNLQTAILTGVQNLGAENDTNSVTVGVFSNCANLRNVTFSSNLKYIGGMCFYQCSNLTNITIPDSVTSIYARAFSNTNIGEKLIIPSSVNYIGEVAFSGCDNLTQVEFKGTISYQLYDTFYGCPNITLYDFRNCTTVPTLYRTASLGHSSSGCQIIVPDALYDTWTTADIWSDLTNVTFVKASEYVG